MEGQRDALSTQLDEVFHERNTAAEESLDHQSLQYEARLKSLSLRELDLVLADEVLSDSAGKINTRAHVSTSSSRTLGAVWQDFFASLPHSRCCR